MSVRGQRRGNECWLDRRPDRIRSRHISDRPGRSADARVFDPAIEAVRLVARTDRDLALLNELGGVVEQQEENLVDLCEVGAELGPEIDSGISFTISTGLSRSVSWTLKIVSSMTSAIENFLNLDRELVLLDPPEIEDVLQGSLKGCPLVERVAERLPGIRPRGSRSRSRGR